MKVAIHQPNFLPWIGYFKKISSVEKFVFLDDVQFERGKTYTSRTKVIINGVENWLTIPIINRSELVYIKDILVDPSFFWKKKNLKSIELSYKKSPHFNEVFSIIQEVYNSSSNFLIDYNIPLIVKLCEYINVETDFITSSKLINESNMVGFNKIAEILKVVNGTSYLSGSGSGSKRYMDENWFLKNNIILEWQKDEFREYPQINTKKFVNKLSIIDLLFNCGKDSGKWIIEKAL